MIGSVFSRMTILTFGTLYPAYYSFKTVRAKSVDEYMKWMIYWIIFSIFSAAETLTDIFLPWLPFYYELKVFFILWLLPSFGNGSPVIYRNFLYPFLKKHETRFDHALEHMKEKGREMLFHYVTAAILCIGRTLMDIVHKTLPNGVMGMLAHHAHAVQGGRSLPPESDMMVISEIEDATTVSMANVHKRKPSGKVTAKYVDDMDAMPSCSRSRGRKSRQSKPDLELDINLNES